MLYAIASDASALKSSGDVSPRSSLRRPAAAIIAALSVESASDGTNTGRPSRAPRAVGVGAEPAVGGHAAGDADALRAEPARRVERPVEQRLDDDALEAGAEVGDLLARERPGVGRDVESRRHRDAALLQQPHHRGLESGETELREVTPRRRERRGDEPAGAHSDPRA